MNQVEMIKPGSNIHITIGEGFLKKLQDLTIFYSQQVSEEDLAAQLDNLRNGHELSEWGMHFETLLTLIDTAEEQAKAQGLIELVNIDTPA